MTDKERLKEIEAKYSTLTISREKNNSEYTEVDVEDLVFLIQNGFKQAERMEELKKERSDWKGKYSILKNKYRALQRKMENKWRYNRALENESRTNEIVLEEFREENKRYREVIEKIKKTSDDYRAGHLLDIQDSFFVDEIIAIINNLEGEE